MNFDLSETEVVGIAPFVNLRREQTKVTLSYLPHLSLSYGVMPPETAVIFTLLDGQRTIAEVIDAVAYITDLEREQAKEYLFKVLTYITPDGRMLVRDSRGKRVRRYDPSDYIVQAKSVDLGTRLEAPVTIQFQLTYACQADCRYCYAYRPPISKSHHLSHARLFELIDELAELGVGQVNLCGGDPVCHPRFIEVVERLLQHGITVDISTKAYISKKTAKRLESAGLDYIQVSIEAADEETGDYLYGRKGQYRRVIQTLKNLLDTRIFVRTNSIITRKNLHQLEDTVVLLKDIGIREMKFSTAFRSMHIDNDALLLDAAQMERFSETMTMIAEKYRPEGLNVMHSVMPDPSSMTDEERSNYWFRERALCSAGRCSMIITPEGKVTICEEAPQEGELVVGNVTQNSIKEVWESEAMKALAYPPRERFAGSPCADCDNFDFCVIKKGHCFKDSLKGYGKLFTTNPFCPRAEEPAPRIY